jgi:hypothetical protein
MDNVDLEKRLNSLETRYLRLKRWAFAGAALLCGAVVMGQAPQDAGEEKKIAALDGLVVRDSQGIGRVRIGVNDNDEAFITLGDAQGRPVVLLSATAGGAEIAVKGGQQINNVIRIASGADGSSGVSLKDASGADRVVLLIKDNGSDNKAGMVVLDKEQKILYQAPPQL